MNLSVFIIFEFCVRFTQHEKDWLNMIFFNILDVKLSKKFNSLLPTIDQYKDFIDKPDRDLLLL